VTVTAADVAGPLARYARRVHALAGERHHVASPLGAWLLLALAGPASAGETRPSLSAALGCDVPAAAQLAAALLAAPHPAVLAAAAAWHRAGLSTPGLSRWQAGLPAAVESGVLPGPAARDEWARTRTLGLIGRFAVELTPDVALVLATALATRVSWARPFDLAPARALGSSSPWAARLGRVLRTPEGPGHEAFIAASAAAGDVAVHAARARDGLLVTSVAAAPGVPAGDVLAAAYDLGVSLVTGAPVARRSLFDLPLGEGPGADGALWTVREQAVSTTAPDGREETGRAVLPAWSARSEHDLSRADLGFAGAAAALAGLLGLAGYRYAAKQAAAARYSRTGFEAAAVSAQAVAMSAVRRRRGVRRTAELRFGRPFAVVAVATDERARRGQASARGLAGRRERVADRETRPPTAWHGLPVFGAWVAEPEDAEPGDRPATG